MTSTGRHSVAGFQKLALAAIFCFLIHYCGALQAQAFPDRVLEFVPGANCGFGQANFPGNVLGPPAGTPDPQYPNDSPIDVFSLGTGGSLVYEFNTNQIVDRAGPDFTIFENPVQPSGHPEQSFADTAIVAVSTDTLTWHTFPFDLVSTDILELPKKTNYVGFAGIEPSLSSSENGISPFDPDVSGGDQFDLADLGLTAVRYVRITDSGDARFRPQQDLNSDTVTDFGNLVDPDPTELNLGESAGFDVDALAAIHTEPLSEIADWLMYD